MNQEVQVNGMTFVNKDPLFTKLRPSGRAILIPEPTNKFDPNAIQVWVDDTTGGEDRVRIGFIPAKDGGDILQGEILERLDSGKDIIAEVLKYGYRDKDIGFNDDHVGRLQACTLFVGDSLEAVDNGRMEFNVRNHKQEEASKPKEVKPKPGQPKSKPDGSTTTGSHYIIGKDKYRRITDLLGCYEPGGKEDADRLTEWACNHGSFKKYKDDLNDLADKGTVMHKLIEDWLNGDDDAAVPQGFLNWWDKYQPEIVAIENRVYDKDIMVAGTYDLLCYIMIKGVRLLVAVDWKSSKAVRKKHKIQSGFYSKLAKADEAWVVAFGAKTKQGYSLNRQDKVEIENQFHKVRLLSQLQELE